jgi:hypothetical protein
VHIFTARVHDGRLILLDPEAASLGLKEGESIDLVGVDELLFQGGALSEEDERAALHRAIEVSLTEADAGMAVELDEVLARCAASACATPGRVAKGSDMERQLTFIDVDENRLELWLKPDRVQLVLVDSRPELEAAELRRFASVLFAEYVARDLADRLAAARRRLQEARDRVGGGDPASGELVAALDGALSGIDDLARSDPSLQTKIRATEGGG